MNLRDIKVAITIDGITTEYKSVREASDKTGITYSSLMNWLHKRNEPRKNISIEQL